MRRFLKRAFIPVTIMVIPHDNVRALSIKLPSIGLIFLLLASILGTARVITLARDGLEYQTMERKLSFYSQQYYQWKSTVASLQSMEKEFRRLFSLGSKEKILENMDPGPSGSVDIQNLKGELERAVESVNEIKDYLHRQKNLYMATPKGWPVEGRISSGFGNRTNPVSGEFHFHTGVDIPASSGSPVRATADGVVSLAGWTEANGHLVVVEHGLGFSTAYAHNQKNTVKVGQRVRRGETVAHVGSTGRSTGPHVHYEIWKNRRSVDPKKFLE